MNKKRFLWLTLFICTTVLLILWVIVLNFYRGYVKTPSHDLIGNSPASVSALRETGLPFSFLVVADTHSTQTAENLIESALKRGNSSFMVIVGDFVDKPDIWRHRFFLTEMTEEVKPPFPVFLVPGNHDIDYPPLKIKQENRRVTPKTYESFYGASNFNFIFNNCLFIMCGVDPQNPNTYLSYLSETLSKNGMNKIHIFVFIHFPPKGFADYIVSALPNEKEFVSLLASYKVTTCFLGHYHGYWRENRNGVNYIILGGGGGRLRNTQSGNFHHMLRINVAQDKIAEEIITTQRGINIHNWFEEWTFTRIFPILQNSVWLFYFILVILAAVSVYLFLIVVINASPRLSK
jgi:3',5'-cyclic AMP phosphodiesterase CpdA